MNTKPIVLTVHAQQRMKERGASPEQVELAIRTGKKEPAQRGLHQYRLNLEFHQEWDGRYYGMQQIVPVVAEEEDRFVVVTVLTFYFQAGDAR